MAIQRGLDVAELDAEAANLHLIVAPPEELDRAVRAPPRQVARRIEPLARLEREGMRHELRCRQVGAVQVAARQVRAGDIELAGHADRRRVQPGIEDVDAAVGDRTADRRPRRPRRRIAIERQRGHDVRFGRPVVVVQTAPAQTLEKLDDRLRDDELFAGRHQVAERAERTRIALPRFGPLVQHDDRKDRGLDRPAFEIRDELGRIAAPVLGDHRQIAARRPRGEHLVEARVEAERRELQHAAPFGERRQIPPHEVDQRAVRERDPLRPPGGARRVDHI